MRPRLIAIALVAACLPACAPSLPALIGAKRYRDAVCAVEDEGERSPHRSALARAVEADLGPKIEIHALTAAEFEAHMANDHPEAVPFARAAYERLFALRVRTAGRPVALDEAGVHLWLKRAGANIQEQPMTRDDLMALFGEKNGPPRTEEPGMQARVEAWQRDVEEHPIANALTMGAWSALTAPSAKPKIVNPTAEERWRFAPITESLLATFPPTSCSEAPSASCDTIKLYRRPEDAARAPITVQLVLFMSGHEDDAFSRPAHDCRVLDPFTIALPEAPTLEERFAARFPEGLRPLSALRR